MKNDLVRRLIAAGCPLEVEGGALNGTGRVCIRQINGHMLNTAFDLDGWTGFILDLQIVSDLPGPPLVIRHYWLDPPWDAQLFLLDDPADTEAKGGRGYIFPVNGLEYPRHMVLNHRTGAQGQLKRGHILDGLLLAVGLEPIPEWFRHGSHVPAQLSIEDQFERIHPVEASLWIDRFGTIDPARRKATPAPSRSRS